MEGSLLTPESLTEIKKRPFFDRHSLDEGGFYCFAIDNCQKTPFLTILD